MQNPSDTDLEALADAEIASDLAREMEQEALEEEALAAEEAAELAARMDARAQAREAGEDDKDYGEEAKAYVDPTIALEAENAELKDRFVRLAADMENLRRRTDRDVKDARTFAISSFARDILSVADNLQRALLVITPEQRAEAGQTLESLIAGVELTEKEMISTMERHGVTKLVPKGEKFDPNFHQAMYEMPNPEVPNNTVMDVVQPGFKIGERVLRPAMVGVAKGGPKVASSAPQEAPDTEGDA